MEPVLVVLLLAFPDGNLRGRTDRRLALAMTAVLVLFYLPTAVLVPHFQLPSPWTSCTQNCPANAFYAGDESAFARQALLGTGSVLVLLILAGVLVRMRRSVQEASAVQKEALLPVLAIGMVRATLVGSLVVARQAGVADHVVNAGAELIAWATPAIAIAFLVGLFRARLAAERTLRALTTSVRGTPAPATLERTVAAAFDDPTLRIALPADGRPDRWLDAHGEPVPPPGPSAGRCFRIVRDGHRRIVGALTCDAALRDRPELLDVAAGLIAMSIEQRRLEDEAASATREAQDSRARLVASADAERRRIERDLHDGAQQRLVAMRIELGLVEDMLHDEPQAAARIRELEASADEALEELRSLAHGVRPPLLNDRGLAEALRAAIARSALPVELTTDRVSRYAPEVESAVYFSMLEALQNVAKHARCASRVTVGMHDDTGGELRFEVRDNGPGGDEDAFEHGAGVQNMRDRIAAVDGTLRIVSLQGLGTVVSGRVPVPRPCLGPQPA
jgi:signal transduction histidine kinase